MEDRNIAMARRIAETVDAAGGRTYFVGGCVRDWLLGRENKDIDIEVHGVSVPVLEGILDELGERTTMGASFGVMGLRHYDLDIAMPRSEVATGRGHKDFEVFVDPFIGAEKAALRRDFTMNAMMQDVLTGEVLDFFGGRADLARGLIRHVSDATYAEDPLRVFRAAQFAARFGFDVAEETTALSAGMDVTALAGERVMGELEKALMKAERPSVFFSELRRMRQLGAWFAELDALPYDAWDRELAALDGAAALRERAEHPLDYMMAALCLALDEADAKRLLARLTSEVYLNRYALNMTGCYRTLLRCVETDADELSWMVLYDDAVCPGDLLLLARGQGVADGRLQALLELYRVRVAAPCVMGRDLVAAGLRPGPKLGDALTYAHRLHLAGVEKADQMAQTLAYARKGEGRP